MAELTSNGVPIEILTDTGPGGPRIGMEVEVYEPDDPSKLIDVVPGRQAPSGMQEIGGPGAFSFKVQRNDPKLLATPRLFDGRNICKIKVDGKTIAGGPILTQDYSLVGSDETLAKSLTISGSGFRSWFDDMCIVPSTKVNAGSSGNRDYSWASDIGHWYKPADWGTPTRVQKYIHTSDIPAGVEPFAAYGPFGSAPANFDLDFGKNADGTRKVPSWIWGTDPNQTPVSPSELASLLDAFGAARENLAALELSLAGVDPGDYTDQQVSDLERLQGIQTQAGQAYANAKAGGNTSEGYVYFRRRFDIAQTTGQRNYSFYFAARYAFEVYIDSAQVYTSTSGSDPKDGWENIQSYSCDLLPGSHVIAIKVYANGQTVAGMICAGFRNGIDATDAVGGSQPVSAAQLLWYTDIDQEWVVNSYPAREPGWNPGELMTVLLADATRYGVRFPSLLSPTYTQDVDSYGAAWQIVQAWSFPLGTSYSDVLSKIEEIGVDIWVDPETLELSIAPSRGRHRDAQAEGVAPIVFVEGKNVVTASENRTAAIVNGLLVQTSDSQNPVAYFTSGDTDSVAKYGRIVKYISSDAKPDMVGDVANAIFAEQANPQAAATVKIIDTDGARPHVDFHPGDWVLAPGPEGLTSRRVMSIAAAAGEVNVDWELELDTIYQDLDKLTERRLANLDPGSLGGTVSNSTGVSGSAVVGGASATRSSASTGTPGKNGSPGATGAAGLQWRGAWSDAATYSVNDVVLYQGALWIALVATPSGQVPGVSAYWGVFLPQGPAGPAATAPDRRTATLPTANGGGQLSIVAGKAIRVVSITAASPCRLRFYRDATTRANDAARPATTPADAWNSVPLDVTWGPNDAGRTWNGDGRTIDLVQLNGTPDTVLYYQADGGPVSLTIVYVVTD